MRSSVKLKTQWQALQIEIIRWKMGLGDKVDELENSVNNKDKIIMLITSNFQPKDKN